MGGLVGCLERIAMSRPPRAWRPQGPTQPLRLVHGDRKGHRDQLIGKGVVKGKSLPRGEPGVKDGG